ncbi:MAG: DUF2914 domain-containing protein [Nannocystaceae bacterium]
MSVDLGARLGDAASPRVALPRLLRAGLSRVRAELPHRVRAELSRVAQRVALAQRGLPRVREGGVAAALVAMVSSLVLASCDDVVSGDGAARRLPSEREGHAMVRLPAANSSAEESAERRNPPRRPRPPVVADPGVGEGEGEGEAGGGDEGGERVFREAPEGTPPHIARVFRRLPLSIHDGPPLGGIGLSGVHVDKIWLGSRVNRNGCTGKSDAFSIAGGDEVNVCFRVVHGRSEEDVDVIWEKDGDLAQRRLGVTIPPLHAYRSRSYLVLRGEYVGAWKVRILSEDKIELASASFTVVE